MKDKKKFKFTVEIETFYDDLDKRKLKERICNSIMDNDNNSAYIKRVKVNNRRIIR